METSKQKAIREAYGEYWEGIKKSVDENGYSLNQHKDCQIILKENLSVDFMIYKDKIRPKSLQGIETNNGWIAINNLKDLELIDDEKDYLCGLMDKEGNFHERKTTKKGSYVKHEALCGYINRYQPIQKPQPSIY